MDPKKALAQIEFICSKYPETNLDLAKMLVQIKDIAGLGLGRPSHAPLIPRVYNKNKAHPSDCKYIGRPGPWGNPFMIGRDGTRVEVIAKFQEWVNNQPALIARARKELRGKHLLCYCAPEDCHGDIWLKIANS